MLFACGLWIACWMQVVLDRGLYDQIAEPAWRALLANSTLALLHGAAKLCREEPGDWKEGAEWG